MKKDLLNQKHQAEQFMKLESRHQRKTKPLEGLRNLLQKNTGGTQDRVLKNYIEFIELPNISIKDKGDINDKQDKPGDQPIHIGIVDLPSRICEAVAGQSVSGSKHNDAVDEHGL